MTKPTRHTRQVKQSLPCFGVFDAGARFFAAVLKHRTARTAYSVPHKEIAPSIQMRRFGWQLLKNQTMWCRGMEEGFVMPVVIVLMTLMAVVAYAALVQASNGLNLSYKQAYIEMARTASKAAVDYSQEQFDNSACGNYSGTSEQDIVNNSRYRTTMKAEVISTSADGFEKTIKGTGSVYLPRLSSTAQYVFDIRSEIVRTFAVCKTPDNFAPLIWLDASNPATLFKPGSVGSATVTATTAFGNSGNASRDTVEERVDNGAQTNGSWQSNDLEMHVCDSTEFTNAICSANATKYLYDGIVFQNVNVPKNATLTAATINYDCAAGGTSGSVTHRIYGIYKTATNLHPDLFTSNGSNQVKTPVTTNGLHTAAFLDDSTNNCPPGNGNSMDVTSVTQEIINNANWDPATGGGRLGFGIYRTVGSGVRKFAKDNIRLTVTYTTVIGPSQSNANGDNIGEWHDLSGHGYHAIATHGNLPTRADNQINGKTIVRFNNGDLLSTLTTALSGKREMTVLAVVKSNFATSGSDGRIISGTSSNVNNDTTSGSSIIPLLRYGANSGFSNIYSGSSSTYRTDYTCGATCASNPYLFTGVFQIDSSTNKITSTLKGNGVQVNQKTGLAPAGSPYTFGINQVYFGGTRSGAIPGAGANYFNGDYAELIVYDQALTCRQVESLEDYLRGKWNLSASAYTDACPADLVPVL